MPTIGSWRSQKIQPLHTCVAHTQMDSLCYHHAHPSKRRRVCDGTGDKCLVCGKLTHSCIRGCSVLQLLLFMRLSRACLATFSSLLAS